MSKFLITGCARSGTVYIQQVFVAAGIACDHEKYYNQDRQGPLLNSEASWEAAPYLEELQGEARLFHQVRHPLHQIASAIHHPLFYGESEAPWREHIYRYCPRVGDAWGDKLRQATLYWLDWNALCDGKVLHRYRVEDVDEALLRFIAEGQELRNIEAALQTSNSTNTWGPHPKLTLDELPEDLRPEIEARAKEYGYDIA